MDVLGGMMILTHDLKHHYASKYLKSKKTIIYFFSSSTADNGEFLDALKQFYEENRKRKVGMEIIYVSSDSSEDEFQEYFKQQGPWIAIPFKASMCDELRWMYDITYLPQLVVVKKSDGSIISKRGKEELEKLGINVLVTWMTD
ncbi:hypothetical protein NQ318_018817 [Aromia moschata]|uniref:Thioredoxin-like fold domain-containing protein n=1 Tax=Aromia moschata TaxID=1265417 RepID=A0AAV8ZHI4_9CUCU|nr:hypothetical protein NQ318_018817 [Aromia moschata]